MVEEIVWRRAAIKRLEAIINYLQDEWSVKVAEDFINRIEKTEELLVSHPFIGKKSAKSELRKLLITKHNIIVYQIKKNKIFILNIYDTRRKFTFK